jgi:hypothetical protein
MLPDDGTILLNDQGTTLLKTAAEASELDRTGQMVVSRTLAWDKEENKNAVGIGDIEAGNVTWVRTTGSPWKSAILYQ